MRDFVRQICSRRFQTAAQKRRIARGFYNQPGTVPGGGDGLSVYADFGVDHRTAYRRQMHVARAAERHKISPVRMRHAVGGIHFADSDKAYNHLYVVICDRRDTARVIQRQRIDV